MTTKEKIIELSDQLLSFLLDYRQTHPGFRFWMRTREHSKAGDQERLKKGQWFQGSDYIFLSFYSASAHVNMTRSIGWVIKFDKNQEPYFNLTVVWPNENDSQKIDLYLDIVKTIGGFERVTDTRYEKNLPKGDIIESLRKFLENEYHVINQLIQKHGLEKKFTIPEEKFNNQLSKVLYHRQRIQNGEVDKEEIEELDEDDIAKLPSNLILYGPPGTGKTYTTINEALRILGDSIEDKSRKEIKQLYEKRVSEGRIVFTTFHQSMSYEDFVEGIKPLKPEAGEPLKYDIKKGVFREICEIAKSNFESSRNANTNLLPFEEAFERLQDEWEENTQMKFPLKTAGYDFTITGFTNTSILFRKASGGTKHTLSINTLKEHYYSKQPDFKSGVGIYYPGILSKLQSYKSDVKQSSQLLNYVLIIDEINRGNVSQVFGELITLIEDSKRLGQPEALTVTLPYSRDAFSVPPIYILLVR